MYNIIMLRFGETKVAKEKFHGAKKKINWDVNFDNAVISKLFETKTNCKYWIGYLGEVMSLILMLPKVNGFVKTCKFKDNKLISFCINDEKLLETYKTIWTKMKA